jgi:acyl-CoA synthetase (AMP-forming)/AMP-acid ligase II
MIHTQSPGRAARFYATGTGPASAETRPSFRELHDRIAGIAALAGHGLPAGDRLALLFPTDDRCKTSRRRPQCFGRS